MFFDPSFSNRYLELPPISTIPSFWTYEGLQKTEQFDNLKPDVFSVTRMPSPHHTETSEEKHESDCDASPPAVSRRQRYLRHSMLAGWMARKVKIVKTPGLEGKNTEEYMCKAEGLKFKFKLQLIQHMRAAHKEVRSVSVLYKRFNKVKLEKATIAK